MNTLISDNILEYQLQELGRRQRVDAAFEVTERLHQLAQAAACATRHFAVAVARELGRLQQRCLAVDRQGGETLEAGLADTARRRIDDAQEIDL